MDSYKLDCIKCNLLIPSDIAIRLRERAKERNVSVEHYINVLLYASTHSDPWTTHHENMRTELIKSNAGNTSSKKGRANK